MKEILKIAPSEIEKKSFEIITEELGDRQPDQDKAPIVKRVIHTTRLILTMPITCIFLQGVIEAAKEA